jgi:hypothetical protein
MKLGRRTPFLTLLASFTIAVIVGFSWALGYLWQGIAKCVENQRLGLGRIKLTGDCQICLIIVIPNGLDHILKCYLFATVVPVLIDYEKVIASNHAGRGYPAA